MNSIMNIKRKSIIKSADWLMLARKYKLTGQEVKVAYEICKGLSDKEIQQVLGIKKGTLDSHINRLYIRVGVNTRINLLLQFLTDIG